MEGKKSNLTLKIIKYLFYFIAICVAIVVITSLVTGEWLLHNHILAFFGIDLTKYHIAIWAMLAFEMFLGSYLKWENINSKKVQNLNEKFVGLIDNENSTDTNILIRDGVTEIPFNAFKDMKKIEAITIPDTVIKIEKGAFMGCKSLTHIDIPDSVTSIGANAFSNCSSLISVKLPKSLTKIAKGTFECCFGLKEINIPDSVEFIDKLAFQDCISLKNIDIPLSTKVDEIAFQGCKLKI